MLRGACAGVVKSTKMTRSIVVRRDYLHYIKKYARCAGYQCDWALVPTEQRTSIRTALLGTVTQADWILAARQQEQYTTRRDTMHPGVLRHLATSCSAFVVCSTVCSMFQRSEVGKCYPSFTTSSFSGKQRLVPLGDSDVLAFC